MARIAASIKPESLTALVDTREQQPLDLSPLRSESGTLQTGDYSLAGLQHLVAVERKSQDDLLACVGRERERFERELERLLAFPHRLIVIESTWQRLEGGQWRSRVTAKSVVGSLLGWMAQGIPIALVDNHQRAGQFVSRFLYIVARRRWRELRQLAETQYFDLHGQTN